MIFLNQSSSTYEPELIGLKNGLIDTRKYKNFIRANIKFHLPFRIEFFIKVNEIRITPVIYTILPRIPIFEYEPNQVSHYDKITIQSQSPYKITVLKNGEYLHTTQISESSVGLQFISTSQPYYIKGLKIYANYTE